MKPMDAFVLLGHDCPYGHYPAPVVPIGRLNGSLVAVYAVHATTAVAEPVEENAEYVRYGSALMTKLTGFDPRAHRLFAYAPDEVECYPLEQEQEFFRSQVKQGRLRTALPYLRLLLAGKPGGPCFDDEADRTPVG